MDQPIVQQTPENLVDYLQPHLDVNDFNKAIIDYGYNCSIENAVSCPCHTRNINVPQRTCINCRGTGWIFVNKQDARLLLQSMNSNKKYEVWNEENTGIVNITVIYEDRLSKMDRITLKDAEDVFTEILNVVDDDNGKKSTFLIYDAKEILQLYMFKSDDDPLITLNVDIDYVLENNQIILNNKYSQLNVDDIMLSVRYSYKPQYLIVDIPRNIMIQDGLNCSTDIKQSKFPIKCVGRIAHYQFNRSVT